MFSDGTQRDWDDVRIAILQHGFDIGRNFAAIAQVLARAKRHAKNRNALRPSPGRTRVNSVSGRSKGLRPAWPVSIVR